MGLKKNNISLLDYVTKNLVKDARRTSWSQRLVILMGILFITGVTLLYAGATTPTIQSPDDPPGNTPAQ